MRTRVCMRCEAAPGRYAFPAGAGASPHNLLLGIHRQHAPQTTGEDHRHALEQRDIDRHRAEGAAYGYQAVLVGAAA